MVPQSPIRIPTRSLSDVGVDWQPRDAAVGDVVFIERARIAHLDGTPVRASARTAFAFQAGVRASSPAASITSTRLRPRGQLSVWVSPSSSMSTVAASASSSAVGASCAMSANGSPDNDEYTSEWTS